MEKYIIQTESFMEAVRKIKEMMGTESDYVFRNRTITTGIDDTLFLVHYVDGGEYLVFDDSEAVESYLGDLEEQDLGHGYRFGEPVEDYEIWEYVHEKQYRDYPILADKYQPARFVKQGEKGTNRYIRKRVHLVGEPVITWSVG